MNSFLQVSVLLHCIGIFFNTVQVASLKPTSRQSRGLGPRGRSSSSASSLRALNDAAAANTDTDTISTISTITKQDANFERRKERFNMKRQLKCKDQFVDHVETPSETFMLVDCTPSATQNFDTEFPTFSPTSSPVPTMTAFPSSPPAPASPTIVIVVPKTPTPTTTTTTTTTKAPFISTPTTAPVLVDAESEAACRAAQDGLPYVQTNSSSSKNVTTMDVAFFYEIVTNSSFSLNEVVDQLETKVSLYLAKALVPCPDHHENDDDDNDGAGRQRRKQRQLLLSPSLLSGGELQRNHHHRSLSVRGVGPGDRDVQSSDDANCQILLGTANGDCYAMEGTIALYVSDTADMTNEEASIQVYEQLKKTFNGISKTNGTNSTTTSDDRPFLDESAGILGLFFNGASMPTTDAAPSDNVPALAERASAPPDDFVSLNGLGVTVIVAACVGVVIVALIAMRKRKRTITGNNKTRGMAVVGDDEDENDDDVGTFYSSPRTRTVEKQSNYNDDDDDNASLPADVVSDDDSSIFHDLDADGGYHKRYVNGTGLMMYNNDNDEGIEVTPTFVKTNSAPFKTPPSIYSKRKKYEISDTVDL